MCIDLTEFHQLSAAPFDHEQKFNNKQMSAGSEHTAPKCGTAAIQLLKNVSFNHDIQSILHWQAIINANDFYSEC